MPYAHGYVCSIAQFYFANVSIDALKAHSFNWYKDCSSKFRSKHSSNTVLCLLRNLLEQSLCNVSKE